MAEEEMEAMTAESLELLDKVRKGKPHYFVMSVKGAQVRSLLISKKPIKAGELKDARGGGFDAIHGTVSGSSSELCFEIASSDGFNAAPGGGKVDKLRKFLGDQIGKTVTPTWKVVPKPSVIAPESDDAPAGVAPPAPPAPPVTDQAAKLTEALKALRPLIDTAIAAHPDRKAELVGTVQKISGEIKDGQFDSAKTNLVAFGKLLQSLGAASPVGKSGGEFDKLWPAAKTAWQEASDTVDEQISRMQVAMRESELEELVRIAEFGFNAISGNFKVPLMAAIRNVDGASGEARKKQAATALTVIDGFLKHLDQEELIAACDEDAEAMFGVKSTIRTSIGAALEQMRTALQAA